LIPDIKNWCVHLKISSEYGGFIGQMGLPTMNFISCPQANGGGAMNLEWIARDFIIGNCQNCKFHSEVFHKNFGRKTIEWYLEYKKKKDDEKTEEEKIVNEVRSKLKDKIINRFISTKTTEVSILKLVDKLSHNEDRSSVITSVLESSKLKPLYFSSLALDYLGLFLSDENFTDEISEIIVNVLLDNPTKLSDFLKFRIKDHIYRGQNHNMFIQLAANLQLKEEEKLLLCDKLLKNFTVENYRGYQDPFENPPTFIINYFKEFRDSNPQNFEVFMQKAIKDKTSLVRKNASLILYHLYLLDRNISIPFLDDLIRAFNIYEDEDGGADWTIRKVLVKICYKDIDQVLNSIAISSKKLSPDGKVELLKLYDSFIETDDLRESFPVETTFFIDKIIEFAGKGELKDGISTPFTILSDLTRRYPSIFSNKFEVFIGFLITAIKEKHTFSWYKDNLDSKTITFNPLVNLNVYEIIGEESKISSKLSNLTEIISNVLQENQFVHFETLLEIIRNLDSIKEEDIELKRYLIMTIRISDCSNINLVQALPDIYNWILDMEALTIRMEALKLLSVLAKNNFEILPQTLIDLLQLLINDPDVVVKKFAIDAYGEILAKKPDVISNEIIDYLMAQYDSRYIGIHQAMSGLTFKLFNFLSSENKNKLYGKVVVLLHSHAMEKEKKYDIYDKLFRQTLWLNRKVNIENFESYERTLVNIYLIPECTDDDFYRGEKAIKTLMELRANNESLNDLWLNVALNFIYKYPPHRHESIISNSFRKVYYSEMYKLKRSDLINEVKAIIDYVNTHLMNIDLYDYDIINILNLMGYFSLYSEILELSELILLKVNHVPSLDYFFHIVNEHKFLAELIESNKNDTLTDFLQKQNNA